MVVVVVVVAVVDDGLYDEASKCATFLSCVTVRAEGLDSCVSLESVSVHANTDTQL